MYLQKHLTSLNRPPNLAKNSNLWLLLGLQTQALAPEPGSTLCQGAIRSSQHDIEQFVGFRVWGSRFRSQFQPEQLLKQLVIFIRPLIKQFNRRALGLSCARQATLLRRPISPRSSPFFQCTPISPKRAPLVQGVWGVLI